MRKDDEPMRGLPAKKYLHITSNEEWWNYCCEGPRTDKETGLDCVRVVDSTETIGDQFEAAYLYLWLTDQARPLAAIKMIACASSRLCWRGIQELEPEQADEERLSATVGPDDAMEASV